MLHGMTSEIPSGPVLVSARWTPNERDLRSMARSFMVYTLSRPVFTVTWTLITAFSVIYGLLAQEWEMAIACPVIVGALALLQYLLLTRGLRRAHRSTTVVLADYGTDAVTIVGNGTTNRIEYHRIDNVRQSADAVLLRLKDSRQVLMLPATLVPSAAGNLLRAARVTGVR